MAQDQPQRPMTDAEIAALRNEMDEQRREIRDYLKSKGIDIGPWDETCATGSNADRESADSD